MCRSAGLLGPKLPSAFPAIRERSHRVRDHPCENRPAVSALRVRQGPRAGLPRLVVLFQRIFKAIGVIGTLNRRPLKPANARAEHQKSAQEQQHEFQPLPLAWFRHNLGLRGPQPCSPIRAMIVEVRIPEARAIENRSVIDPLWPKGRRNATLSHFSGYCTVRSWKCTQFLKMVRASIG